jgi:hypothetical protein
MPRARRNQRAASPLHCRSILSEKVMPVATTSLVERIARVSAGRVISSNADGDDPSAGDKVDEAWQFYRDDAVSILKTMREPDEAAASAGDVGIWERMIEASIATAR